MGILLKSYGKVIGILWKFYGIFMGFLWEFLWEFYWADDSGHYGKEEVLNHFLV